MTIKEFYDELYYGHDIIFEYEATRFFIEHKKSGLELYQLENDKEGKLIESLSCGNKSELLDKFLNKKILPNNQSILDSYNKIEVIDIE